MVNGNVRIRLQDIEELANSVEPQLDALILVGIPPLFGSAFEVNQLPNRPRRVESLFDVSIYCTGKSASGESLCPGGPSQGIRGKKLGHKFCCGLGG